MSSLQSSVLVAAAGAVAFFFLAAILVVLVLTRFWEKNSRRWLENSRSTLRKMELDSEKTRQSIQDHYSVEDPEPYGSRLKGVNENLFLLDQQVNAFRETYLEAHRSMKDIRLRHFGDFLRTPWNWHRIYQQVRHLHWNENNFSQLLQRAGEDLDSLQNTGLDVARHAREVHASHMELRQVFDQLSSSGMHGEGYNDARAHMDSLTRSMESIPLVFLTGSDEEVLLLAEKGIICSTHATLQQVEPSLKSLGAKLSAWNDQYQNLAREFQQLQLVAGKLENMVRVLPGELRSEATTATLDKLKGAVTRIRSTLDHPTPHDLTAASREVRQMKRTAAELEEKSARIARQYQASYEEMQGLVEGVDRLRSRCRTLEKNPLSRLVWDETGSQLDSLHAQVDALSRASPPSPATIKERTKTIAVIKDTLAALEHHYQQVEGQFTQLLALREKLQPQKYADWAKESRQLAAAAAEYSRANWANEQDLDLLDEVSALEDDLAAWRSNDIGAPVRESTLPGELAHGLRIDALHQVLVSQMAGVRYRLDEIKQLEERSLADLQQAGEELEAVAALARGIPPLPLQDPARLNRLRRQLDDLASRFSSRQHGTVEEKSARTAQLLTQLGAYLSSQVAHMYGLLDEQREGISKILDHIDSIGQVDNKAIATARQLVERIRVKANGSGDQSASSLKAFTTSLQQLGSDYHTQSELLAELRGLTSDLDTAQQALADQQQSARQRLGSSSQVSSVVAPSDQELLRARQEFNRLEKEWSLTREQMLPLYTFIAKTNEFCDRYQKFNKGLGDIHGRLEDEQARIRYRLADLDTYAGLWEQRQRSYRGDAGVQRQIQNLLASVRRKRQAMERLYHGSRLGFDQYARGLEELAQTLKDALIPLNAQQKININGEMIE